MEHAHMSVWRSWVPFFHEKKNCFCAEKSIKILWPCKCCHRAGKYAQIDKKYLRFN